MPTGVTTGQDTELCKTNVQLTFGQWKKLLKLVDSKTVKVEHPDEFAAYQALQERLLEILSDPKLFPSKKDGDNE